MTCLLFYFFHPRGKENVTVKVLLCVINIISFQCHTISVPYHIRTDFPLSEVKPIVMLS